MNIDSIQSTTQVARRAPAPESPGNAAPAVQLRPNVENGSAVLAKAPSNKVDKPSLEHAVQRISEYVSATRPEISFTIDEKSGTQVVRIVDSQSKQVIRQMPSEEAIQIAQALDKLQGLFVKDQA